MTKITLLLLICPPLVASRQMPVGTSVDWYLANRTPAQRAFIFNHAHQFIARYPEGDSLHEMAKKLRQEHRAQLEEQDRQALAEHEAREAAFREQVGIFLPGPLRDRPRHEVTRLLLIAVGGIYLATVGTLFCGFSYFWT